MLENRIKIEVLVGSRSNGNYPLMNFEGQIAFIFNTIADFKDNGGNYFEVNGRFKGKSDEKAYQLNFYCEKSDFMDLIEHTKSTFNNIKPEGVKYVSIKSYEVESYSFEVSSE